MNAYTSEVPVLRPGRLDAVRFKELIGPIFFLQVLLVNDSIVERMRGIAVLECSCGRRRVQRLST